MARSTKQNSLASIPGTLVLIGAGKMGGAMLEGWLARKLPPNAIKALACGVLDASVWRSHQFHNGGTIVFHTRAPAKWRQPLKMAHRPICAYVGHEFLTSETDAVGVLNEPAEDSVGMNRVAKGLAVHDSCWRAARNSDLMAYFRPRHQIRTADARPLRD